MGRSWPATAGCEAAKLLGLAAVPDAAAVAPLAKPEKRAYVLADNKLAEKAGWDRELLAIELQGLIDIDFDVELTGFEVSEIDVILEDNDGGKGWNPTALRIDIPGPPGRCARDAARRPLGLGQALHSVRQRARGRRIMSVCWVTRRPSSSSPTRPTMCGLTATSAARAPSATASSLWRAAR